MSVYAFVLFLATLVGGFLVAITAIGIKAGQRTKTYDPLARRVAALESEMTELRELVHDTIIEVSDAERLTGDQRRAGQVNAG